LNYNKRAKIETKTNKREAKTLPADEALPLLEDDLAAPVVTTEEVPAADEVEATFEVGTKVNESVAISSADADWKRETKSADLPWGAGILKLAEQLLPSITSTTIAKTLSSRWDSK